MDTMAQQVLIYSLTGSATSLGLISFIALIPLIPVGLVGGSLVDRFPRRSIILMTQAVMMAQALVLAALVFSGAIQEWHVYVMALVLGTVNAVDIPARQAFTVDMVEGREDLFNAIALNAAIFNGARAIGPALAGLAVAAVGVGMAFLINGLSFIAVITSLLMMRNLPLLNQRGRQDMSMGGHIWEGLRFIRSRRELFYLVSLVAVSAFLSMPYSTLMPVFATRVLGTSAAPVIDFVCHSGPLPLNCTTPEALPLGMLLTTVGIGALIGSLAVASLPEGVSKGRLLTAGNLIFPILLLLFALSHSFILSMVVLAFVGVSFVMQNALANTLLQLISPDELRSRVMGVYSMTFQGMMRMGGLQAGIMADAVSASFSVGIGAVLSLFYGLYVAFKVPEVRRLK